MVGGGGLCVEFDCLLFVCSQVRRILHVGDSARSEGGLSQHELLRTRKLLADGELHRSCQPAAVAGPCSPGQRGQGREGLFGLLLRKGLVAHVLHSWCGIVIVWLCRYHCITFFYALLYI